MDQGFSRICGRSAAAREQRAARNREVGLEVVEVTKRTSRARESDEAKTAMT